MPGRESRFDSDFGDSAAPHPRYRDLVYEQLAAQIPEDVNIATLLPIQQISKRVLKTARIRPGRRRRAASQLKLAIDAATGGARHTPGVLAQ